MNNDILDIIKPILGKRCCRIRVGTSRSLSMGFGEKVYHNNPNLNDTFYGEWELGTYYCAWRVMKGNRILCGASDPDGSIEELNKNINSIEFGCLAAIIQLSDIDVRLESDSGIAVDFLATISDDDEYFHIFCPNHLHIELSIGGKWSIGKSSAQG